MDFAIAGTITRRTKNGSVSSTLPAFTIIAASENDAHKKVAEILGIDLDTMRGRFAPQLEFDFCAVEV